MQKTIGVILLSSIVSMVPGTGFAGGMGPEIPDQFSGLFGSIGVGALSTLGRMDSTYTANTVPNQWNTGQTGGGAVAGQLGLGYGKTFNQTMYLGGLVTGDLFAWVRNTEWQTTTSLVGPGNSLSGVQLKHNGSVNLLLKPGYVMDFNTLFYGLAGVSWSWMSQKYISESQAYAAGVLTSQTNGTISKSKTIVGPTVGLGIERYLRNNLTLALDYSYTYYNNISVYNTWYDTVTPGSFQSISPYKSNLVDQKMMLRLNYYF